jgi:hypothetical protein
MKSLEVAMMRIYIPNDDTHLEKVLQAIEDFGPGGDIHILETRPAFDAIGKRLPSNKEHGLMVEFFEEPCRAQMFVDAFHEELMPCRILGWTTLMLEGDSLTERNEREFREKEAGDNSQPHA